MHFKVPQNNGKYEWTNHVHGKMMYYRISESMIKRVIRAPHRVEEGIAEKTLASMQAKKRTDSKGQKKTEEIWVMYQLIGHGRLDPGQRSKVRVISAWRYPGESPKNRHIPIPEDILSEINHII